MASTILLIRFFCGYAPCYLQVSKEGTSPFTYIIVDNET